MIDKINYFTYGSYTISERWRVNIFFVMLAVGVAWLLWLKAPRRDLGAVYFFWLFPTFSYIFLTGGNMDLGGASGSDSSPSRFCSCAFAGMAYLLKVSVKSGLAIGGGIVASSALRWR